MARTPRRKDARRIRQKDRRDKARAARRQRGRSSLGDAARWPVREAWVGQDWHDPAALLDAFLVRAHDDGRAGWCHLQVDLSDGTLEQLATGSGTTDDALRARLERTEERPMVATEGSAVAALLEAALTRDLDPPAGVSAVEDLLHDQDPLDSPIPFAFGFDTPTDPGPTEPRVGVIGRLLRAVGIVRS